MKELVINRNNFENDVVNSDKAVLLDFWSEWCAPCQMLSPILSEIADNYGDKIKVGKVNIDYERELSAAFNISSIPALFLIKNGKIVKSAVGFRDYNGIEKMIKAEV